MKFEGEEVPERRFSGTIVGVGDHPSSRWPGSEWRSLKVQWDEPSPILRLERVSPWEIEPLVAAHLPNAQAQQRNKRARPPALPSPMQGLSSLGMLKSPSDSPSAFTYHDPLRGPDLYQSPKLGSVTKTSTLSYNGNLLPLSSNSIYQSNIETAAKSITPASDRRHGNGYRLFGIELVDHSAVEANPLAALTGAAVEDFHVPLDIEYI